MATGTNGIATFNDCYSLRAVSSWKGNYKCPLQSEILEGNSTTISGAKELMVQYGLDENQLVPWSYITTAGTILNYTVIQVPTATINSTTGALTIKFGYGYGYFEEKNGKKPTTAISNLVYQRSASTHDIFNTKPHASTCEWALSSTTISISSYSTYPFSSMFFKLTKGTVAQATATTQIYIMTQGYSFQNTDGDYVQVTFPSTDEYQYIDIS